MPAKSQSQRGLIFAKRAKYGSVDKAPKKWKWCFEEGWENKGKLPEKVKKKKKKNESVIAVKNESIIFFKDYLLKENDEFLTDNPEHLDYIKNISQELYDIMTKKYNLDEEDIHLIIDELGTMISGNYYDE